MVPANPKRIRTFQTNGQRGMTLVELLVGMTIALIGTLAILQVFNVNEGIKRTATSAGDAQQGGSFSTYTLERQLRMGGAGFQHIGQNPANPGSAGPAAWGCPLKAWKGSVSALVPLPSSLTALGASTADSTVYVNTFYSKINTALNGNLLRITPTLIVNGGGNAAGNANDPAPDTIIVMAGQNESFGWPLKSTSAPNAANIPLVNTVGVNAGVNAAADPKDLLVAVDQDPASGISDCRVVQANGIPTLGAGATVKTVASPLVFDGATYTPTSPAGLTGYSATVQLVNIGDSPGFFAFGLNTNASSGLPDALLSYDLFGISSNVPVSIADNIVNLQAVYGVSTDATSTPVTSWVAPVGTWGVETLMNGTAASNTNISRIRAIRIAVVAKSSQLERVPASGIPVSPGTYTLFSDLGAGTRVNGTWTTAQQNYRYRYYNVTIPLRNMLLMNNG